MKTRTFFCMLMMTLGAILLFFSGCSGESVPPSVLLEESVEKALAGDWASSGKLAAKVLDQDKNNVDALLLKAVAESHLGNGKSALDHVLQAASLEKESFLCQYIKGMLLYRDGKHALAVVPLQEALRLRPGDVNTLVLLAKSTYALKKYDSAAGYFARIAQNERYRRNALAWNGIGVCLAHSSPAKALPYFKAAQRIAPEEALTFFNMAVLHDGYLRNPPLAVRAYERFLEQSIGKMELDDLRARAELRLDSLKSR